MDSSNLQAALTNALDLQNKTEFRRIEDPPPGVPRYIIDNESFFSVTQILDDGKFDKVDPLRLIHAQILGSVVHLQVENYLTGQKLQHNLEETLGPKQMKMFNIIPPADEKLWQMYKTGVRLPESDIEELVLKNRIQEGFDQFLEYSSNHEIEVVFAEKVVWNTDFLYAGTVDLMCLLDGKLTIIDHKTSRFVEESKNANDSYTAQLSGYLMALKKMGEGDFDSDLRILHLNPIASKPKLITRKYNFDIFLRALTRFSKQEDYNDSQNEKEIVPIIYRTFKCPDTSCSVTSKFPFPKDPKYLSDKLIQRMAKLDFHEDSNHYAMFHIQIPNYNVIASFIPELS